MFHWSPSGFKKIHSQPKKASKRVPYETWASVIKCLFWFLDVSSPAVSFVVSDRGGLEYTGTLSWQMVKTVLNPLVSPNLERFRNK